MRASSQKNLLALSNELSDAVGSTNEKFDKTAHNNDALSRMIKKKFVEFVRSRIR